MITHPPDERARRVVDALLVQPALARATPVPVPLAARMVQLGVPGVSVAVLGEAGDGGIAWAHAFGVRDAGRPGPVTTDTLFQAASISKPVAAFAALRLVDRGVLDLDQDVNERLRSWRIPPNGQWQPRVTLRHLLTHTGGLTVHGFPGYPPRGPRPTLQQVLDGQDPANTPPVRVDTLPGVQHRYSGGGYCVLQQLLEDVVGAPLPAVVRDLVLEPCGMAGSTIEQPLSAARCAKAATGHRHGGVPVAGGGHVYPEMAAAGLWTTPSDLARFAIQVRRAAAGEPGALLSQSIATQMLSPHVDESVGLGVVLAGRDEATASFRHGGANEGFRCHLVAFRHRPLGAIVMTNGDAGGQIVTEIMRSLDREYAWGGGVTQPPGPAATLDAAVLAPLTGDYELRLAGGNLRLRVAYDGGALRLRAADQPPLTLHAESATRFFAVEANLDISFLKDEAGGVAGLSFRQNGREMRAERLPGVAR